MPKKIAVIDGNSLMHRAFHAVPATMNAPDGTPTNAAFGFLSMLLKFIDIAHPDAVICAFDAGRPAWRMKALASYKGQRPPMDPDLKIQFPLIEDLLSAMDIPVVRIDDCEGDDILGSIAARDEALGFETLLVTGDRDAYQLASDLTSIVTTKKGITDVLLVGPDEVKERYGITPGQVPDFLGLKGDSSDNIPGVAGIGEKTAAKLLQQFETLDGIYENLDKLTSTQQKRIQDNKELAYISRSVATITCDIPLDIDVESITFPSFDIDRLTEAFTKVRFMAHLNRLLKLTGNDSAPSTSGELSLEPYVEGADAAVLIDEAISQGVRVSISCIDSKTTSLFDSGIYLGVCTAGKTAVFRNEDALDILARCIKNCPIAVFDAKQLVRRVFPPDSTLPAKIDTTDVLSMDAFDISLAAYVLDSSLSSYSLESLLDTYLGKTLATTHCDDQRVALEAQALSLLIEPLTNTIESDGSSEVYYSIDLPLIGVLSCLERTGVAINALGLKVLGDETADKITLLQQQIYSLAGEKFNIDSPKQLSHILFEVLGLRPIKKTQRGYSTDMGVLTELSQVHDLPKLVLSYRELAKIKSTYIDALPAMRAPGDHRVHTTFNETVTATGRLSSSNPNLQNIPVRSDFGRQIRTCFVPLKDSHVFLAADYSQIELRLLAHLSGDEKLINAFLSGEDFHTQTASHVFGVPLSDVTPALRGRAKAVNFGIVYGQQAFGLSRSLHISMSEAQEMIDRYFSVYSRVREFLDATVKSAHELGYVQTMFGRKRHIPELSMRNVARRKFGERTAMNHPMQGSAADIIKLAMRKVADNLISEGFAAQMLLQVHDELDFSVAPSELEDLSFMVRDAMENIVRLDVPLVVSISSGSNWAQAH